MTTEEITAVHERVMELIRLRKWNKAAELADTVSEQPDFHPWDPMQRHWGLCEKLADIEKLRNPARAARLYKMALESLRRMASAAGEKGKHFQPQIAQLEKKIQRLDPEFVPSALPPTVSKGVTMKTIRIREQGEPEVMKLEDAPLPEPGAGTVRLKIETIGVNYVEIYQRSGQNKMSVPFVPGSEAAGIVDALGAGVSGFKVGDHVASAAVPGAYAEYAVVPAEKLLPIPDGVDSRLAAAVLLQGMTAHYLSFDSFPIQPGNTVLVHAAAGGTGALLVQVAKMRGARVIGTVSNAEKAELAREAGADEVLFYNDFEAEVKRLTNGRGVDAVYDSVGKDTFDHSLNCLRVRGTMVLYGASSGAVPPFDPIILLAKGSLFLTRPTLGHYTVTREELLQRSGDVFRWIAEGKLTVRIDRDFPLSDAPLAHRALASRATKGKVLLIP